jgi:hypothetical protein
MFKEMRTHNTQTRADASRSMVDLRAVSTPTLLLSRTSPTIPKPQIPQECFPFPTTDVQSSRQSTFVGTRNNGDCFPQQSIRSSIAQSPDTSESSRDSSRNRGRARDRRPLVRKADRNPNRTRRSLASEALPYVAKADVHIKKEEPLRNFSRRLSKMPSMPQLKKRASQVFNLV